jgi:hypothetical protein
MTTTITKGQIGEQDLKKYDGSGTDTFSRITSAGDTVTLNKVGYEVDVLSIYGAGVSYTDATITSALTAIGTSTKCTIVLKSGTWTIDENIDWSSYTNVTFKFTRGAILTHSTYSVTLPPNIEAGDYQILSGTGTVTGLKTCNPYWFGLLADGTDETTTVQKALKATVAGGILTIPNGTRWDYDTIKSDHPDDVIIIDYSCYDWQYDMANSAQVRYITNTSSPSSKNSHNYIFMGDYHPAVVVDNLTAHVFGDGTANPRMSYLIRENGDSRWQIGNSYYNERPLFALTGSYYYPVWVTGTAYAIYDTVKVGSTGYYATVAHTSGDWATDLAAGKWATQTGSTESPFEVIGMKGMPTTLGGIPTAGVKLKIEDTIDREMLVYLRAYTGNDLRIRLQSGSSTRWSILSDEDTGILSLISAVSPQATYTFSPDGKIGAGNGAVNWNTSYVAEGTYDFSVDGGAISTINLTEAGIPDNATVKRAWYEVLTPPTSDGEATIALGVSTNDADGIKTATAYNDAAFNAGYHDGTPDGAAANFTTKTTGNRYLCITIAGATLTAGKIKIFAELLISE